MVRISIVTIVKDHAEGLNWTCRNVLDQTFTDWELILIVGSSEDTTLITAKEFQAKDSRIHLHEQKGTGIYGAMNEGIQLAGGEFIWFMNAGDRFAAPLILEHAIEELSRNNVGVLIGGYRIDDGNSNQGYRIDDGNSNKGYSYANGEVKALNFAFNRRGGCHQGMVFRTQVLKEMGGFNTQYSLAADFDLVLRVIKKAKAMRTSEIYASIEPGGRAWPIWSWKVLELTASKPNPYWAASCRRAL